MFISIVDISTNLKNIDIDIDIVIDIDKEILENIDIDIDKEISANINIDKISNRLEFGISNSTRYGYVGRVIRNIPEINQI